MLKFVSQPIFRGAHIQESFIFGEKFVLVGRGLTFFGGGAFIRDFWYIICSRERGSRFAFSLHRYYILDNQTIWN